MFFGCSALFDKICAFILKDLTWQSAPTYYAEADQFELEKLTAASARMCALHFPSADHDELILLKTGLFKAIIESPHLTCDSKLLSRRVADYCRAHSSELTPELLMAITPAKKMPDIAPKEALYLYEVSGEEAKWRSGGGQGWAYACHHPHLRFSPSPPGVRSLSLSISPPLSLVLSLSLSNSLSLSLAARRSVSPE